MGRGRGRICSLSGASDLIVFSGVSFVSFAGTCFDIHMAGNITPSYSNVYSTKYISYHGILFNCKDCL